jgi:ATP-dependent RNA helicase RhlE
MSFNSLGLSAELLRAVDEQGYGTPTSIQRQAIPVILEGRDVMAGAQTGTGKTAGFTLPLLQRLHLRPGSSHPIRALILTPTRELAAQVEESVKTYGRYLPLKSVSIFGGVGIGPQIKTLRRGVDIVIATPGRLLDHLEQKTIDLSKIEILVLDEADRMLDMGFIHQIRRILPLLPKARQNLLFSATFSNEIKKLADGFMRSPALIEAARRNTAVELITQVIHPVEQKRKRELLSHLIGSNDWRQVLVFIRTKHNADRLAKQLKADGLSAAAIHGNKTQGARTRALADFKSGAVRILVATDIAARGLDIDQLPHVINYDLPNVPEDYIHRIGRTGRAGNEGRAISLVSGDESKLLRDIERLMQRNIARVTIPGYDTVKLNADDKESVKSPGHEASDSKTPSRRNNRRRRPVDKSSHSPSQSLHKPRDGGGQGRQTGGSAQQAKPARGDQRPAQASNRTRQVPALLLAGR